MPSITITDLNNAKLDVDHIAAITTSSSATATDRLGTVKTTLAASLALIAADVAAVDASRIAGQGLMDADTAAVDARKVQALAVDIPAAIASVAAINNRGAWATGAAYTAGYPSTTKDIASHYDEDANLTTWYICVVPHTASAAFAADAAQWRVYQGVVSSDLAAPNGSDLFGFIAEGANAQPSTGEAKLREIVSIGDFGGTDDWNGATGTNNYTALLRVYNDYPNGVTVRLPKLRTGVYMSNGAQYAAPRDGFVIDLDEGVSIHNLGGQIPILAAGVKVTRRLTVRETTQQVTSDFGAQDFTGLSDKPGFMTASDGEAPKLANVSHLFASHWSATWPNGPMVVAVPANNSSDTTTWAANAAGFNLTTVPLRPGSVLSCYLADNAWLGTPYAGAWIAGIITDSGFAIVRQDVGGGGMIVSVKSGSAAIQEVGAMPPTAGSLTYRFSKGLVGIRIHTPTSFSVLVNGIEVARIPDAGGVILSAGFGAGFAQNANPALVASMSIAQGAQSMGVQPLKIVVVGDSTADPAMGSPWSDYLRQYASGVGGVQFLDIKNIAIAGDNSAMQLTRLQAANIAGYSYCLIQIGINDIQGGGTVQGLIDNITSMVLYCKNNGVVPIVGIPAMWYGQAEAITAGNLGGATSYKEQGSPYRATLLRYLANANVAVNLNSLSDFGAVIPSLLNQPHLDSVVYDNVHPTVYGRMLLGYGWAKTLIGQLVPKTSKAISPRQMPATWFGGNYGTAEKPTYSIEGDTLRISGTASVTTDPTAGEIVFTLPEILRQIATVTLVVTVASVGGSPAGAAFLQIDTGGVGRLYGAPAGTRFIYFSGASIQIASW